MKKVGLVFSLLAAIVTAACDGDSSDDARPRQAALTMDGKTLYQGVFLGYGKAADLIPEVRDHFRIEDRVIDPTMRAKVGEEIEMISALIETKDPQFFGEFRAAVLSGSHLIIRDAMKQAATLTVEALREAPRYRIALKKLAAAAKDPSSFKKVSGKASRDTLVRDLGGAVDALGLRTIGQEEIPLTAEADVSYADADADNDQEGITLAVAVVATVAVVVHAAGAIVSWVAVAYVKYFWAGGSDDGSSGSNSASVVNDMRLNSIAELLGPRKPGLERL